MDKEVSDRAKFGEGPTWDDEYEEEMLPRKGKRVVARRNTLVPEVQSSPSESAKSSVSGRRPAQSVEPVTPVLHRYASGEPISEDPSTVKGSAPREGEPSLARQRSDLDAPSAPSAPSVRPPSRNVKFDSSMSFSESLPPVPIAVLRSRELRRRRSTYYSDNTPAPSTVTYGQGTSTTTDSDAASVLQRIRAASPTQSVRRQYADARAFIGAPSTAAGRASRSVSRPASRGAAPSAASRARERDPLRIWKLWRDAFGWADSGYRQDWVTGRLYGRTRRRQRLFTPPARA